MHWRGMLALGGLVLTTACAPLQPHARLLVTSAPATPTDSARLTLKLDDLFPAARRVLYVDGSNRVKVTIDGPGLADAPFEQAALLGGSGSLVSLEKVPVGTHRVITLQALDESDVPLPGAVLRTAGEIKPGANSLTISSSTTTVGAVVARLLATDREKTTDVLSKVDLAGLEAAIAKYVRRLKVPHWGLLDVGAIAQAIYTSNGVPPAAPGSFALKPGKVIVRPGDFPPGANYVATVNDPVSLPVVMSERVPVEIGPVAPGNWTLTLRSADDALPVVTRSVTVTANGVVQTPVSFVGGAALADMPNSHSAGASAGLTIGTAQTLVMITGSSREDDGPLQGLAGIMHFTRAGGWVAKTATVFDLLEAASSVYAGKIYFFGGFNGSTVLGDARRYDPAGTAEPANRASLPGGLRVQGAVAGTIGDTIYLTGGMEDFAGEMNTRVLAYKPDTDTYGTAALPALPSGRYRPAGAVVNGKWYLFGGSAVGGDEDSGGFVVALNSGTAFTPGASARWDDLPAMPTARYSAGTVVVDGKIWVIGGASHLGVVTSAVEVFDTATGQWSTRPPLRVARANPACALLNGKIVVAGGALGGDSSVAIPVASVEELEP